MVCGDTRGLAFFTKHILEHSQQWRYITEHTKRIFCCELVAAAAAAVADGRSGCGCGWCCENFLGSWIYYFIVVDILFYCSVYIILLD